jgi:hypothetical protein
MCEVNPFRNHGGGSSAKKPTEEIPIPVREHERKDPADIAGLDGRLLCLMAVL